MASTAVNNHSNNKITEFPNIDDIHYDKNAAICYEKENTKARQLYLEACKKLNEKRFPRTAASRHQSEDEESQEDHEEYKKKIMVGSNFQAIIPEGFFKYDDVLPYENEDKLLWDPSKLSEKQTEEFLRKAKVVNTTTNKTINLRDDEQALYLLLQCGHNIEEALRRKRLNVGPATSDEMSIWSEEECRNFESGMITFGKNFYAIKHAKVRTRSVGELIQFYYLWKKTERYDVFVNKTKLEKKKYNLYPELTDFMDRFLEEKENGLNSNSGMNSRDRSLSPSTTGITAVNCLLQADTKRQQNHKTHYSTTLPGCSTTFLINNEEPNDKESIIAPIDSKNNDEKITNVLEADSKLKSIEDDKNQSQQEYNINKIHSSLTTLSINRQEETEDSVDKT